MSPNEPQTTSGMPACFIAVAACSREDPVPKLKPENKIGVPFERKEWIVAANDGS